MLKQLSVVTLCSLPEVVMLPGLHDVLATAEMQGNEFMQVSLEFLEIHGRISM